MAKVCAAMFPVGHSAVIASHPYVFKAFVIVVLGWDIGVSCCHSLCLHRRSSNLPVPIRIAKIRHSFEYGKPLGTFVEVFSMALGMNFIELRVV